MSDHEATPKANQVKDTGKKAYSEADQGRGSGRTNPMMNRASAEALPKIFSPLAAATSPMRPGLTLKRCQKFPGGISRVQ